VKPDLKLTLTQSAQSRLQQPGFDGSRALNEPPARRYHYLCGARSCKTHIDPASHNTAAATLSSNSSHCVCQQLGFMSQPLLRSCSIAQNQATPMMSNPHICQLSPIASAPSVAAQRCCTSDLSEAMPRGRPPHATVSNFSIAMASLLSLAWWGWCSLTFWFERPRSQVIALAPRSSVIGTSLPTFCFWWIS